MSIKHKKVHRPSGFTLIELLFATAILGFMLTVTLVTFIGVFRFYVWSGVTRTNQSSAREVLDVMARDIAERQVVATSNAGKSVCLAQSSPGNGLPTIQISQTGTTITTQEYSDDLCQNVVANSTKTISNPSMNVTFLEFQKIEGALNNPILTGPNANQLRPSVEINITITNGTVDPVLNNCRAGDTFCDQAKFVTAVTQRQNSQ